MNPWHATSPTGRLSNLKVIHTDGKDGWSIAKLTWDEVPDRYGCRWDGNLKDANDRGNPTSHGHGTWFILPETIALKFLDGVVLLPAPKPSDL